MKKLKFLPVAGLAILFILTGWMISVFIYRLVMPYNAEGNYFDDETGTVYHQQSVLIFGIVSIVFAFVAILIAFLWLKRLK